MTCEAEQILATINNERRGGGEETGAVILREDREREEVTQQNNCDINNQERATLYSDFMKLNGDVGLGV